MGAARGEDVLVAASSKLGKKAGVEEETKLLVIGKLLQAIFERLL